MLQQRSIEDHILVSQSKEEVIARGLGDGQKRRWSKFLEITHREDVVGDDAVLSRRIERILLVETGRSADGRRGHQR